MTKPLFLTLLVLLIFLCSGCVTYFGYDGPYEGRVIDKDTRQPIEGVVVHGTWFKAHPGPGGATHTYYDSKEVLTDKDGKFKINGVGLLIMSNMEEIYVYVLKTGYPQIYGTWEGLRNNTKEVEWIEGKPTIKLQRMTLDDRKNRGISGPLSVPNNKMRLFNLERNKENTDIGRPSSSMFPVE